MNAIPTPAMPYQLEVYRRQGEMLRRIRPENGYVSPRLGVRFDVSGTELIVHRHDGHRFQTFVELEARRQLAEQRADMEQQRADEERRRAVRLAALARKANQNLASPQELQELERLAAELGAS
jgi:hypothetical protein